MVSWQNLHLRWLAPVSSRGEQVTVVRHARETHAKEERDLENKCGGARLFCAGYFCPVLNEIRVYPRLHLLVRP